MSIRWLVNASGISHLFGLNMSVERGRAVERSACGRVKLAEDMEPEQAGDLRCAACWHVVEMGTMR
jgi:hypothetical protein